MKINPIWWRDPSLCEWKNCDNPRWAPYSWGFCPLHFAEQARLIDQERKNQDLPAIAVPWARSRFCGVLNGFTPELGDVAWDTNYPRDELEYVATEKLGLQVDRSREPQFRAAKAVIAAKYPTQHQESQKRLAQVRRINETGSV